MRLLAVDGNSIMNRAFYGIRVLSNSKGQFTNALTGFMNIYLKEIAEVKPDCVAVAFDLKAPTFRHKMYDGYKANRKGMPDELAAQMPIIKDVLQKMNIKSFKSSLKTKTEWYPVIQLWQDYGKPTVSSTTIHLP